MNRQAIESKHNDTVHQERKTHTGKKIEVSVKSLGDNNVLGISSRGRRIRLRSEGLLVVIDRSEGSVSKNN